MNQSRSQSAPVTRATRTSGTRGGSLAVWVGYVVGIIACGVLFTHWQVEPVPAELTALAIAQIGVCLFPLAKWMSGPKSSVPMFELICIAYAAAYALPLFTLEHSIIIKSQSVTTNWSTLSRALQLSLVGSVAMIVGYTTMVKANGNTLWRIDLPVSDQQTHRLSRIALIVAILITLPVTVYSLKQFGSIGSSIAGTLQMFVLAAIVKLAEHVFKPGVGARSLKVVLFVMVSLTFASGLLIGMLGAAFTPIICVGIIYWLQKRKLPWAMLLLAGLTLVIANDAKHSYRQVVWVTDRSYSIEEKIGIWVGAFTATIQHRLDGTARASSVSAESRIMSRMDLLHTFAYIIETTPETVPHYWGKSYSYLLIGWIPRMLWPDKPIAAFSNNMLAVDYDLLSESQLESTMTGIGLVAEAYANFGATGCVVILTLFGAFLALVGNCFNGPHSDFGRAIYLCVMVDFLNGIGSSVTQLFYFVVLNGLLLALLLRPFATSFRVGTATRVLVRQRITGRVVSDR